MKSLDEFFIPNKDLTPPPLPEIPRWLSLKQPLIFGCMAFVVLETLIFVFMKSQPLSQQFFAWIAVAVSSLIVLFGYSSDRDERKLARNKAYVLANRDLVQNCSVDKSEMYLFCTVVLRGFDYPLEIERGAGCLGLREELLGIKHRLSM